MAEFQTDNALYFAVLPTISLSADSYGKTEHVLTLLPGRDLATEFPPDEVDAYLGLFNRRTKYLVGGRVKGYECQLEETETGNFAVRVTQNVE